MFLFNAASVVRLCASIISGLCKDVVLIKSLEKPFDTFWLSLPKISKFWKQSTFHKPYLLLTNSFLFFSTDLGRHEEFRIWRMFHTNKHLAHKSRLVEDLYIFSHKNGFTRTILTFVFVAKSKFWRKKYSKQSMTECQRAFHLWQPC